MDVRDRILLPLTRPRTGDELPPTDVSALFLHLLLFDTVIIRSFRLHEIAGVARAIGIGATIALLDSGCVKIRAESDNIGSVNHKEPHIVQLVGLFSPEPETIMSQFFKSLEGIGPFKDVKRLKHAILRQWLRPTGTGEHLNPPVHDAIREAVSRSPVFLKAIEMKLVEEGAEGKCPREALEIEQIDPSTVRFRATNLGAINASNVVRGAVLALAYLNREFDWMKRDQAVTALADDSVALIQARLDFLWAASAPEGRVKQFHRVVTAAGLPDFDDAVRERGIDVDRFLKVRQSDECQAFRTLLNKTSMMSDAELNAHVSALRGRLGDMIKTTGGKLVRLLATTAAGVLGGPDAAGLVIGAGASGVDSFVLEKIFPTNGAVTFINKQYPSLFYGQSISLPFK